MPLFKKNEASINICMPSAEILPGYVDTSVLRKHFPRQFEDCCRSLSLNKNEPDLSNELQLDLKVQNLLRKWQEAKSTPFQICYTKGILQNCHKIGEGLYGEVFLHKNGNGGTSVAKIIPFEGSQIVNGEKQKKFEDILSEAIIATQLSNLRYNKNNNTDLFIEVQNLRYVHGCYPEELMELWKLYEETRGSENDFPGIFTDEQQYIILETSYGGCDLESFLFDDASQAISMFIQVSCAIAVAEAELLFEHRDLHWGNILLTRVPEQEEIIFILNGQEIRVKSCGVKATIIDFTFSRITVNQLNICNDLGKDRDIFNGSGDYQFEIYRLMQKKNGNEWFHFDPYSNILWLSYVLDKTLSSVRYTNSCTKLHKKSMAKLRELNLDILAYDSTREFVLYLFDNNKIL
ncbi:haspin [Rhynchophorus ferrugineus]|uniref:haspin n=1 Tax=Rhynchophorus ferrugineus TaxID=354439 RepID=UPI003FCEA054